MAKSYPPHLPPPSCSLEKHHQWERLKIVLVATGFGLAAGLSGAAVMLGWIWPKGGEGDIWAINRATNNSARGDIIERGESRMSDKIFTIYQKLSSSGGVGYFAPGDKLADAIVITSEGWVVAYLPTFDGKYKDWRILGERGIVYQAAQALLDHRSGLVYIKLAPPADMKNNQEQFKVVIFSDGVNRLDDVLIFQDGAWQSSFSLGQTWLPGESHLDTAPRSAYALGDKFKPGAIAIDNQGRVVGFLVKEAVVLPATAITRVLPGIQTNLRLLYPSLGAEGWFSKERPLLANNKRIDGFLVTRVVSSRSLLRKGDILMEINGREINSDNIWYNRNEGKVRLKISRGGKLMELETGIVEL